ncbi:hypothetical protein, partial [Pseudomonas aeruginosa]
DFKRLNGLIVGFVIKGNVHLYLENNLKVLNQGDLFFVNHRDLYRFQFHKDSIICFVHFQLQYLADKIDDDQRLYFNLTDATTKKNINQMRNIIARLVSTHIRNNELSKL